VCENLGEVEVVREAVAAATRRRRRAGWRCGNARTPWARGPRHPLLRGFPCPSVGRPAARAFPTDERLIDLHPAGEPLPTGPHEHRTQPMQHRPRRLVRADLQDPPSFGPGGREPACWVRADRGLYAMTRLRLVPRKANATVPKILRGTVVTHRRGCGKPDCPLRERRGAPRAGDPDLLEAQPGTLGDTAQRADRAGHDRDGPLPARSPEARGGGQRRLETLVAQLGRQR